MLCVLIEVLHLMNMCVGSAAIHSVTVCNLFEYLAECFYFLSDKSWILLSSIKEFLKWKRSSQHSSPKKILLHNISLTQMHQLLSLLPTWRKKNCGNWLKYFLENESFVVIILKSNWLRYIASTTSCLISLKYWTD